jgi:hypothetical protein
MNYNRKTHKESPQKFYGLCYTLLMCLFKQVVQPYLLASPIHQIVRAVT